MKRLLVLLFIILLASPSHAVLLLDGNVPPGCTASAGVLTCTGFAGDGSGLTGVTAAPDNETLINRLIDEALTVADTNDTTAYVGLWDSATGSQSPKTDGGLTYNAGTGTLTATAFVGALTGNASTASALAANGANCSAGQAPLGVDAAGAVEGCFAVLPLTGGTLTGVVTLDDGSGASPALHFIDETNEDVYFYKVDAGYLALYVNDTNGGLYIAGGNLQVGNIVSDPPTQTQDGNDAYVSGNAEIKGQIWGGAGAFNVDADGDVTAKSYNTTRGDAAQYIELYEATSDGDSKATIAVPAKGTGLAGDVSITVSQSLALTGTMTDGKYCTYASSGNVISCNSTPAGTGDFLADGSVPMTDGIVLADGNGDAPTTDGEMKYDRTAEKLQVGDGAATKEFVPVGVSSMITKYQYFPAAWMEDNATTPCAAAAVISGEETKARLCDDNESVIVGWQVDPEWTAGFKYRVYYGVVANAEENDTVTWRLAGCSVGNQDALTCTAGDQVSISDELGTDDDANELKITAWSDAVTITNLAAGEWARLTLMRGTDDEATEVNLIGIEIKYQAKVSAASDY